MVTQRLSTGLPETPYAAIARVASHATPRRLVLLLAAAVAVLALSANAVGAWPLPALALGAAAGAVARAALWGIAAHEAERHGSAPVLPVVVERCLAIVGTVLAAVAVVALLLAVLGAPWVL